VLSVFKLTLHTPVNDIKEIFGRGIGRVIERKAERESCNHSHLPARCATGFFAPGCKLSFSTSSPGEAHCQFNGAVRTIPWPEPLAERGLQSAPSRYAGDQLLSTGGGETAMRQTGPQERQREIMKVRTGDGDALAVELATRGLHLTGRPG